MVQMKPVTTFYAVLGVALLIGLIITLVRSPLFPLRLEDKRWLKDWLGFTVRSPDEQQYTAYGCVMCRTAMWRNKLTPPVDVTTAGSQELVPGHAARHRPMA
jgi:hypothetical protein